MTTTPTLRERMRAHLEAAGPALGEARPTVVALLRDRLGRGGGFRGRGKREDLYYTLFGLEGLLALGESAPFRTSVYLESFTPAKLDLIHLACLARAWTDLGGCAPGVCDAIIAAVERHRASDGGYNEDASASRASAYGCYLAYAVYEDLGRPPPELERMIEALYAARSEDGAYANQPGQEYGLTAVTAGVITLRRHLGLDVDPALTDWLLQRLHRNGGFMASPLVPLPDLLSTATALTALSFTPERLEPVRQPCLRFLDALWDERGGFRPHAFEKAVDTEYTWYGLLCLGILTG
ncbi:MAG: prenyltransferase/squalene oxidase repeat-containing protein [Planctomycetota bacterium]